MRIFIFIVLTLFAFTGCSSKNVNTTPAQTNQEVVQNDLNDEFDDEFGDEFGEEKEVYDPLEPYNRAMTSFNDGFYEYVVRPTADGYAYVVPQTARQGIDNVFDNLMFPIRFLNNVLQLKFANAGEELGRFVLNSTFGLLGLIDVADMHTSWEEHNEDFGQTLGFYGVPAGPHIVMPFLGPSNLRDFSGTFVDFYADPTFSVDSDWKIPNNLEKSIGLKALDILNKTSLHLGEYEQLKKDAIDLYPFLRDIYEQKRESDIKE